MKIKAQPILTTADINALIEKYYKPALANEAAQRKRMMKRLKMKDTSK